MEGMEDVILIMVCLKACNPIENVVHGGGHLPRLFQDHSSKYKTARGDQKRRTSKEVFCLINAYLPKDWALVLVGLTTSVPTVLEEGFMETRILTLDDNMERTTILTEWIREHEGAFFEYHWKESKTSALPGEKKEEKEKEEKEEGEEQVMMTSDVEPLIQPIEEENEQGIPMEKEVLVQISETATSEGHAQELPIHASKMKEAMNDIVEHCQEQENVDETKDHIGGSSMSKTKKWKQMNPTVVQDIAKEIADATHLENLDRSTLILGVDSTRTSTMQDSIRLGCIT